MNNSYITKEELRNSSDSLYPIKELSTREDVATLLDTYLDLASQMDVSRIIDVKEDIDHIYVFVVSDRLGNKFDLLHFINQKYVGSRNITSANLKLLFPVEFSRGVGGKRIGSISKSNISRNIVPSLIYKNGNKRIKLDNTVIIGRSKTKANFIVSGNSDVSRIQCEIGYNEEGILRIIDKNSKNGTYVNGTRIPKEKERNGKKGKPLRSGDTISFAGEYFKVEW